MSSFGAKRKARIIQTSFDDEGDDMKASSNSGEEEHSDQSAPPGRIKFGRNKPAKASALRKSIKVDDDDESQGASASAPPATTRDDDDDGASAPVVVRPGLGRSGSTKTKRRPASSRLSFGPGETAADAEDDATGGAVTKPFTPKKPLGQRLLETNALRKSASLQNLAGSLPMRFGGQDDGPKYSKEYLEELQSSTPNTPQNIASLQIHDDSDAMELDQSELEGALVVQSTDVAPPPTASTAATHILTEAEIRERKERRVRLAHESDFISLDDGSDDEPAQAGRVTVNFPKKKPESRLIAEDEDLGEGYDEFVSDGGLALGKKAERDATRRHRQEMAELIQAAEGGGSDAESDDSEAERRAAYEAAQRRAGMDGLARPRDEDRDMDGAVAADAIPRMKPLPKLGEVLQRMREIVQGLEDEVTQKRARIGGLEKEKEEILAREAEVQEILNQAGAKYQAAVASAGGNVGDVAKMVSQSPLRPLPPGIAGDLPPVERGLESFGATPTRREDVDMS